MSDEGDAEDTAIKISVSGPYEGLGREVVRAANSWLERILGPAATEFGHLLSDGVGQRRARRAATLVSESERRLLERGVQETRQVSPTVLIPLLEAASLETDQDLYDWWVELLSSAADPTAPSVPVLFPRILAELSPVEAQVIDWLYNHGFYSDSLEQFHAVATVDTLRAQIPAVAAMDTPAIKFMIVNLCRLGICEPRFYTVTRAGGSGALRQYDKFDLSQLGAEFVAACRGDKK